MWFMDVPYPFLSPSCPQGARDDACACALHALFASPRPRRTVGPNDKATKKVQRTEAAAALRFSVGHGKKNGRRKTSSRGIEVRNPIKCHNPIFS